MRIDQGVVIGVLLLVGAGMLVSSAGGMLLASVGAGAASAAGGALSCAASSVVLQADSYSAAMADAANRPRRILSFMEMCPLFWVGPALFRGERLHPPE